MQTSNRGAIKRRAGALVAAAGLVVSALAAMTATAAADPEPGQVEVTPLSGTAVNKCQGAMPTPGSENTDKRLVGGTLVPGGTAVFEFTYPFDPTDTNGRQDFVILDCVFVDDEPVLAFELHGVPNGTSPFVFQFTVDIPADIQVGAEFCNVGKTTAAPSSAQASNRKAGPACFVVGGGVRVLKTDPAGLPLTGATFSVACTPSSDLMDVVIEGVAGDTWTGTTGDDNAVTISGPLGTTCTVTETSPPPGYVLATPAAVQVTISALATPDVVVVNPPVTGILAITKVSDAPGSFDFTVDCPGTAVAGQPVTVAVAAAGAPGATSAPITGLPVGVVCTVAEVPEPGFVDQPAQTVTIAAGANAVTFTNRLRPPVVTIVKTADAAAVTAGAGVGFTVTVASAGVNPATDVTLDDPLPAAAGVSWSISPAYAGPGTCSITGAAPAQALSCAFGTMAPGATASVHVASATTAGSVGTLPNTATARAANHGPVSAAAAVVVNAAPATNPIVPTGTGPTTPTTPVTTPVTPTTTPVTTPVTTPAPTGQAVVAAATVVAPSQPATSPAPALPAPVVLGETLPRTGSDTVVPLTVLALLLIGAGAGLRRWGGAELVPARAKIRRPRG